MKYSRQILILMFFNLTIALVMIFIGHEARNIEIENSKLKNKINLVTQEININHIEYTFHNNTQYLKKIYSLYNSDKDSKKVSKILTVDDLKNKKYNNIQLVDY